MAANPDTFTPAERATLRRHVSNVDGSVFALTDLPEVVKGALFARYSRSAKSLRRLLLDEFTGDLHRSGGSGVAGDARGTGRAERLYERMLLDYGDDSVAQLGGAHVAVEGASNLLTKVLERGRLAAYLEQSTRYVPYHDRPGGRYRYHRDPDVMSSGHAAAYEGELDAVFDAYADAFPRVEAWAARRFPRAADTSERAWRSSLRAKACDVLRGLLPAATTSNVGIYASGQAYEQLLLRLRSSELAEARACGDALLAELRTVIPSFVARVDRPDRGGAWAAYLASTRADTRVAAGRLLAGVAPEPADEVTLVDWSPDADAELVTGMLYPHTHLPEAQLRRHVDAMAPSERAQVVRAYAGTRGNRRHKPGRALERIWYRFDVCGDYGAFRDLQRHRMCTIEWQELSPLHGYEIPPEAEEAGVADACRRALERQAGLWQRLHADLPRQAQYAVGMAYRIRYSVLLNARAALHLIELRTTPQGHPSYRRVAQRMHELIATRAGHTAVAELMRFADHGRAELERLDAERAGDARRAARDA
ncbi:MAG: FAD-dependent thymidylate synthase [Actinomycetota bacterium]|nr:FAD-dependent thymidylate synthase [Actinomycetota bacterium]